MDKQDRITMRQQLRKPKMFKFFVYFPKKGILKAATIEFQKTKAQRELRLKELKAKRGNKFARGMIERSPDGAPIFVCLKTPPERMEKDLKQWAKKVPELSDWEVATFKDSRAASDIREDLEEAADEEAAHETAVEIREDDEIRERLNDKLHRKQDVLGDAHEALDRFAYLADSLDEAEHTYQQSYAKFKELRAFAKDALDTLTQLASRAQAALEDLSDRPLDDAEEATLEGLPAELTNLRNTRTRLQGEWGRMIAMRQDVKDHLDAALVAENAAMKGRSAIDGRKSLARFTADVDVMEDALDPIERPQFDFEVAMYELHSAFEETSGLEAPTVFAMPAPVDAPDLPLLVAVLDRLHATALEVLAFPLKEELLARLELLEWCGVIPVEVQPDESATDLRKELARCVLLSEGGHAKLRTKLAACDTGERTKRFMAALQKKGFLSSSEVTHYIRQVRELFVEVESKHGKVSTFHSVVIEAGLAEVDLSPLEPFLDFPAHLVGGAFATITDDDGSLALVSLKASSRVIVVGGGPIGLMSAIEAASKGMRVTLFESRSNEYTRQNVLTLEPRTVNRLKRYGFYDSYPHEMLHNVKVADLEDGLLALATSSGITIEKGRAVTDFETDPSNGDVLVWAGGTPERCKLAIICVGPGINLPNSRAENVILSDALGITIKQFELADHVMSVNLDTNTPEERDTVPYGERTALELAPWLTKVPHPEDNYILVQLTEEEYEAVEHDRQALEALGRQKLGNQSGMFPLFEVTSIGRFKVQVQRAEHFVADGHSAVVLGDSAGTPHPQAGSGTNTGAKEVDAVSDLTRRLAKGGREGRLDEEREAGLDAYEDRLQEIVSYSTSKGVRQMVELRMGRLRGPSTVLKRQLTERDLLARGEPLIAKLNNSGNTHPDLKDLVPEDLHDPLWQEDRWADAEALGKKFDEAYKAFEQLVDDFEAEPDNEAALDLLEDGVDTIRDELGVPAQV